MAAQDPSDPEPRPSDRAVAFHRFEGVTRTRRHETTLREHQVRQRRLVDANERHDGAPWPVAGVYAKRGTPALSLARRANKHAPHAPRFARTPGTTTGGGGTGERLRISLQPRRQRV